VTLLCASDRWAPHVFEKDRFIAEKAEQGVVEVFLLLPLHLDFSVE